MDAWNTGTHGRSGLTDRVRASTVDEAEAERQVIEFLQRYVPRKARRRCAATASARTGASSPRTMPKLEAFFHYRNLDVSTLKELARALAARAPRRLPARRRRTRRSPTSTSRSTSSRTTASTSCARRRGRASREPRRRCRIMGLPQSVLAPGPGDSRRSRSSPLTVSVARLRLRRSVAHIELCTQGRRRCRRRGPLVPARHSSHRGFLPRPDPPALAKAALPLHEPAACD